MSVVRMGWNELHGRKAARELLAALDRERALSDELAAALQPASPTATGEADAIRHRRRALNAYREARRL